MTSADPMLAGKDPRTLAFGSLVVLAHLDALSSRLGGALTMEDPEDVHQLRVTSRRLRADLPVFKGCFEKEALEGWKASLRMLTTSLGQARDADVQIMFLQGLVSSEAGSKMGKGLDLLLEERRSYRTSIQPEVSATLGTFSASGTLDAMRDACLEVASVDHFRRRPYRSPALRLTARRNIRRRLKGLLDCQACIGREEASSEHHRMRIAAKKLRYTLEIFSSLFPGKLKGAIGAFKHLQDLLGEMHDCDVWSVLVPERLGATDGEHGPDAEQREQLRVFIDLIADRRHAIYTELVRFWGSRRMRSVLRTLDDRFAKDLYLPGPTYSRIGVISDVHGNQEALDAVLSGGMGRGVKLWICAGDIVGLGPCPDEVVRTFRDHEVLTISGNYDSEVLMTQPARWKGIKEPGRISKRFTREALSRPSVKYLSSLQGCLKLMVGRTRITVFHGTPASDDEKLDPVTDRGLIKGYLDETSSDIMVSGHTHAGAALRFGRRRYLNPGSVGRPGDGDARASYAVLSLDPLRVELVRVPYDVTSTARTAREKGLPEIFARQFISGRSMDHLSKEDDALKAMDHLTRFEMVRQRSMDRIGPDRHTEKVLELSLSLFEGLSQVHGMGEGGRFLIACAALLHDIGWAEPGPDHHKRSMEMVLSDGSLPLASDERAIVANMVRYHNSLPKLRHGTFRYLDGRDRTLVLWASSILRLADSLDASHGSIVRGAEVLLGPNLVVLRCTVTGDHAEEMTKMEQKKDLFEKVSGRKLRVEWASKVGC